MAPKQVNHKCKNFKIGFNGLAVVDYPTYIPVHYRAQNSSWMTSQLFIDFLASQTQAEVSERDI